MLPNSYLDLTESMPHMEKLGYNNQEQVRYAIRKNLFRVGIEVSDVVADQLVTVITQSAPSTVRVEPVNVRDVVASILLNCIGLVPGMIEFEVGVRSAGLDANVDVLLVSSFVDAAALDAYQNHPHHKAVSSQLGLLRESRSVLDHESLTPGTPGT